MKMTRQHFQALADLCAEIIEICDGSQPLVNHEAIVARFVKTCERSNPAFREDIFRDWVKNFLGEGNNP